MNPASASAEDAVIVLDSPVQPYAWGSPTVIPQLLGRAATGEPVAELWLGAHPSAPSMLAGDADRRSLLDVIDADPERLLGPVVNRRFGQLPFLLKVLAVERPLSMQAHPSRSQARAGFAAENAAGLALDAPERVYRDANHKPEQVCAITDFEGLCGFRPVESTAQFYRDLDTPQLEHLRQRLIAEGGLRDVVTDLLSRPAAGIERLLAELVPAALAAAQRGGQWSREASWVVRLDREYPGDRGTALATLLNLVQLKPGQALFLPAGHLHAYLHGVAIEVLANSDNVVRGGLTGKHIDPAALLEILAVAEQPTHALDAEPVVGGQLLYPSSVADFRLARIDLDDVTAPIKLAKGAPQIVLCTEGAARVESDGQPVIELARGGGLFIPARVAVSIAPALISSSSGSAAGPGRGTVFVALPNL